MSEAPSSRSWRVEELIARVQARGLRFSPAMDALPAPTGRLVGALADPIVGAAPLDVAQWQHLAFLANPAYRKQALASRAGVIVLGDAEAQWLLASQPERCLIVSPDPYAWFALALQLMYEPDTVAGGIAPSAQVHPEARVAATASIAAQAVVDAGAVIDDGARIGPGAYVGRGARIGARTELRAQVVIEHGCRIGSDGLIHAGAVIGADGFGFAPHAGAWIKIPQVGTVVIGDQVEIGAGTTIDRGALGDTVVEDGVKIDNQVQIGHNCRIGAYTVIAGCVGIAGSAEIGRHCRLGGAAMILGHLHIADGTTISAATMVSRSIREPGFYTGFFPMMTNREWERNAVLVRHLDELRQRLRRLEALQRAGSV